MHQAQAQAQSQARGGPLAGRGSAADAAADPALLQDAALAWRRHIYVQGLYAQPLGGEHLLFLESATLSKLAMGFHARLVCALTQLHLYGNLFTWLHACIWCGLTIVQPWPGLLQLWDLSDCTFRGFG